jgi:heme/copper-type cytochrome/quinol oxidase subunit 3
MTGLHAMEFLVALLMNVFIQVRTALGPIGSERSQAVENVTLYWYFVNVVWVFVFSSLFLWPYL